METQLKVFEHQYQPGWFVADETGMILIARQKLLARATKRPREHTI
jgi:hypothetical protein